MIVVHTNKFFRENSHLLRPPHKNQAIIPVVINVAAASHTIALVPNQRIKQKPVINVPRIDPAVEQAYMVPTTPPVRPRSARVSLITMGDTMLRTIAGKKKIREVVSVKFHIIGKLPNQSPEVTTFVVGRMEIVSIPPTMNITASTKGEGWRSAILPPR